MTQKCRGLRVDGIIVLDSGAYIRGAHRWTEYMAELLFHIYVATGQRCIAVAQGGLSFVEYSEAKTYKYVLERITQSDPRCGVRRERGRERERDRERKRDS